MESAEATVTVARTSTRDMQQRQIILSIDGQPFATLMFGASATRVVAPGRHTLKAYNTLVWKTLEFDLAPGEHIRFSVANVLGKWTFFLVTVIGVGPIYLSLERSAAE